MGERKGTLGIRYRIGNWVMIDTRKQFNPCVRYRLSRCVLDRASDLRDSQIGHHAHIQCRHFGDASQREGRSKQTVSPQ